MDCLHTTSTYSESLRPNHRPSVDTREGMTSCLPSSSHCTHFASEYLQETLITQNDTQRHSKRTKATLRNNQSQSETHLMTHKGVERCIDTHRRDRILVKVTSFLSKVKKIFNRAKPLPCSPSTPFLLNWEVDR